MNVRAYTTEDFEMVREWAADRGLFIIPELMGPTGFVVEDQNGPCAVAMVYLMFEVPIAIIDNFITRPGLGGRQVLVAWRMLWRLIVGYLKALQPLRYKMVRTYCDEKLLPLLKKEGWHIAEKSSRQIIHAL